MLTDQEQYLLLNQIDLTMKTIELVFTSPSSTKRIEDEPELKVSMILAMFIDGLNKIFEDETKTFKEYQHALLDLYVEIIYKG